MSKKRRQERHSGKSQALAAKRRMDMHMITLLLTVAIITAVAFILLRGRQTVAQSSAPQATKESAAAPKVKAGFDSLKGRWRRPDGGYVIDISEIDASGKMVAQYYNPRPINVSRSEASQEGTTINVFIELQDINYPGSTYTLTYDPQNDQLKGVYFQAALQQSFDVVFVRLK
jgi:uncharacterized protein (DUF2147 family)